jgi:hypothetical protein
LDEETESTLFLTNTSDKDARIGFQLWANGQIFYLGSLELVPHETRMTDLRKLRDAQETDLEKHRVPAGATDGSVLWLRLDDHVTCLFQHSSRSAAASFLFPCLSITPFLFINIVAEKLQLASFQ